MFHGRHHLAGARAEAGQNPTQPANIKFSRRGERMNNTSADFRELTFDEISGVNGGIMVLPVMITLVFFAGYCVYKAGKTIAERHNREAERILRAE